MLPDNLGYLFDAPLALAPSRAALLQGDRIVTYEELETRTNRMANALRALGVREGSRVALMFGNDFRFIEAFLAPMRLGAVSVPLNTRMGDDALAYILADSEAPVVVANAAMAARAKTLAARVAGVRHVVADGPDAAPALDYEGLLDAASPLLAHAGQIWNADAARKAHMLDDDERALVAVPLFHKNAMIGAVKPLLLAGGSLVILPGFDPGEVIRAIERYRVTYMTGVPAMYKMILAETELLGRHDVRSLRYALCGSAEVPEDLLEAFTRVFGADISESYGLTEGGPVPVTNTRWGLKRRGSCGRTFPGCDVKLVGPDGTTEVGVDEPGELVTRNPGLARGYWKLPGVTAQKLRDGWLYTGDLLRRDADGFFYFVGRKDDMINVAGENVYPKEVEDILLAHPNLRDAAVVPAPHEMKGEVPVAFVVESEKGRTTEDEVKRFFLERGAPYAHPRRVWFVDALPLGGTGKLDRAALKQRARERGASSTDRQP